MLKCADTYSKLIIYASQLWNVEVACVRSRLTVERVWCAFRLDFALTQEVCRFNRLSGLIADYESFDIGVNLKRQNDFVISISQIFCPKPWVETEDVAAKHRRPQIIQTLSEEEKWFMNWTNSENFCSVTRCAWRNVSEAFRCSRSLISEPKQELKVKSIKSGLLRICSCGKYVDDS